jgi:import inner membrane translocase subunit TIM10
MEMYTHLFNNISATCFRKCASRKHKEPELSLGEMSCADRCVAKYLEAQEKVGVVLQKANEAQAQQQKAMADMQAAMGGGGGR